MLDHRETCLGPIIQSLSSQQWLSILLETIDDKDDTIYKFLDVIKNSSSARDIWEYMSQEDKLRIWQTPLSDLQTDLISNKDFLNED